MDLKEYLEKQYWNSIIVDLDKTLINLQCDWFRIKQYIALEKTRIGLKSSGKLDEDIFDLKKNFSEMEFLKLCEQISLLERSGIKNAQINFDLLKLLKVFNGQLCIFSSNCRGTILSALSVMGLETSFIVGKEDVIAPKPSASGLELIFKTLNLSRETCLYIGDSYNDMIPGRTFGVTTLRIEPMSTFVVEVFEP